MNQVAINGNATRDPEVKDLGDDNYVCNFGIGHNKRRKRDDEWYDEPHFFEVTVWGAYGKMIGSKLQKGDLCFIAGDLSFNTWENEDGAKRNKVFITAFKVEGEFQFRKAGEGSETQEQVTIGAGQTDDIPF